MTYPKITTEKGPQSSQDCGPAFLPPGRPGLDECHFFLDVIELIEPGLDIFLLPNFFWGEFFFAIIAEKPHTQPDLSGEDPTLWHSWFPPFQV